MGGALFPRGEGGWVLAGVQVVEAPAGPTLGRSHRELGNGWTWRGRDMKEECGPQLRDSAHLSTPYSLPSAASQATMNFSKLLLVLAMLCAVLAFAR